MKHTMQFSGEDGAEILVDAFAPVTDAEKPFRRMMFDRREITRLIEFNENISGIVLRDGVTIPVLMSLDTLRERTLATAEQEGRIDLRAETGTAVTEFKCVQLSKTFNPVAEVTESGLEKPHDFKIRLFAHAQENDRKFFFADFKLSDIQYFEAHQLRKDREIFIQLKQALPGTADHEHFYVAITLPYFKQILAQYTRERYKELDLLPATRVLDINKLEM